MPSKPDILGTRGVIAATHYLAAAAGMAMFEKGGNAFDAAVAAGLALQVVEPHMNGPGGDVPILLHRADSAAARVICGQGPAPKAATIAAIQAEGLSLIPGTGLLPAVVPGAFGAWMQLALADASLPLRILAEPALDYARGHPLAAGASAAIAGVADIYRRQWAGSAALFLPGNRVPRGGEIFSNPVWAATLDRLIRAGEEKGGSRERQIEATITAWYEGFVAEAVDRFCSEDTHFDAQGRAHRALLRGDDLSGWRAREEAALSLDYAGVTVFKPGPWSQGPVILQQLSLLRHMAFSEIAPNDPAFIHAVIEAAKLAFADRDAYYGDPDFVAVPLARLLSNDHSARRAALIEAEASCEFRPSVIDGFAFDPQLWEAAAARRPVTGPGRGEPLLDETRLNETRAASQTAPKHGDTCHVCVIDAAGNMVAATPSGGWLQASPIIPELGFALGTRGQMFWLDAKHPNALQPGKRPRTTLSPSLALKDGEPFLAFGTPGGDQQDQWPLHFLLRLLHGNDDLQTAIDRPAFHTEHFIGSFDPRTAKRNAMVIEADAGRETIETLRALGHDVQVASPSSLSRVCAARKQGAVLGAAADARTRQAYAMGR
jgi:gamma-glutamyltranspeptidase/glutathione hydrolase